MTRTIVYGLVIVGCAVAGIIIAGPTASTSPQDRLETIDATVVQVAELPASTSSTSATSAATGQPQSAPNSSTTTTSTSLPAVTEPEPTPAPTTTTVAAEDLVDSDDEHQHASDASDIDLAVLVVLAGTSDRYDTPADARRSYLEEFATSDVVDAFGTLTDTERTDRVVKMSTLTSEPTTSHPDDATLLIVDVTVEITTFSASADRNTVQVDVTATVDTNSIASRRCRLHRSLSAPNASSAPQPQRSSTRTPSARPSPPPHATGGSWRSSLACSSWSSHAAPP